MKTIAYFFGRFLITTTLILAGCGQNGQFEFLNNEKHSLDDYKGQWLFVNFWAEWCAPCLEEVPALNTMYSQSTTLNLMVIGVSYDPLDSVTLNNIVKQWDIKYPVMKSDPIPILPFELPSTLPANYLLNPEGRVVVKLIGKQTASSLLEVLAIAKQNRNSKSG